MKTTGDRIASALEQLVPILQTLATDIHRSTDHLAPPPADIVGTPYVASRMGLTTVWVAEMARNGDIPLPCIVAGTGNGKPWKFHRNQIDRWIEKR